MAGKERGNLTNVLEKILEEIESLHTKILRDKFAKQVTEQEIDALVKAKQIIRSHMDAGKDLNVPTNDWIPVSERLPDDKQEVWISTKTDCVRRGMYKKQYGYEQREGFLCGEGFICVNTVNAWIPCFVPEPYKTEIGEEK